MPVIDYKALSFWLDALWKVGTVIGLVVLWLGQRSKANAAAIEDHEGRLDVIDRDLVAIKERMSHQPTHDDLQLLHDRISKVNDTVSGLRADVSAVSESIKGLRDAIGGLRSAVDRLNDHHMRRD